VETLHHKSAEMPKRRNVKLRKSRSKNINKEFHRLRNKSISEFRILVVGRVKTLHHQKSQNHEMRNAKIQKKEDSFGYRELEESRLFIIRSPGITKCETSKPRKKEDSFRYRDLEESRLFIIRSPGIVKCEMPKS
jgi:hypothetical protein